MVKQKKKYGVIAWLWILFGYSFLGGCAEDGELILIGSEAEAVIEEEASGIGNADVQGMAELKETVMIQVYVCGAVMCPGVVTIPEGSRVEVALNAAGGFSEEADESSVNLADWVADGQMLYFPTEEEAEQSLAEEETREKGLVNINTADVKQLCTLPGIGESRAADIIAFREENGDFASCEEIMQVTGIKESIYEKMRDKIVVK